MPEVIVNYRALRYFAKVLERESEALNADTSRISKMALELATSWRDKKYDAFFRDFYEAKRQLDRFLEHSEKYRIYLREKAKRCERYLSR